MDMIIIGTAHDLEIGDPCLDKLIAEIVESEKVVLIGEEIPEPTIARQVALRNGIAWVHVDMNIEQRIEAGIYEKLANRMQVRDYDARGMPRLAHRYARKEDGVRENFWLDRIEAMKIDGTTLIMCGCFHAQPLSEKAQQRGHRTKVVFHRRHCQHYSQNSFKVRSQRCFQVASKLWAKWFSPLFVCWFFWSRQQI